MSPNINVMLLLKLQFTWSKALLGAQSQSTNDRPRICQTKTRIPGSAQHRLLGSQVLIILFTRLTVVGLSRGTLTDCLPIHHQPLVCGPPTIASNNEAALIAEEAQRERNG